MSTQKNVSSFPLKRGLALGSVMVVASTAITLTLMLSKGPYFNGFFSWGLWLMAISGAVAAMLLNKPSIYSLLSILGGLLLGPFFGFLIMLIIGFVIDLPVWALLIPGYIVSVSVAEIMSYCVAG